LISTQKGEFTKKCDLILGLIFHFFVIIVYGLFSYYFSIVGLLILSFKTINKIMENKLIIGSIIILVISIIFNFFTPKKRNSLIGYRTFQSLKNQENWDYSNKIASKGLLIISTILFSISLYGKYVLKNNLENIWLLILVFLISILIIFIEIRLRTFNKIQK